MQPSQSQESAFLRAAAAWAAHNDLIARWRAEGKRLKALRLGIGEFRFGISRVRYAAHPGIRDLSQNAITGGMVDEVDTTRVCTFRTGRLRTWPRGNCSTTTVGKGVADWAWRSAGGVALSVAVCMTGSSSRRLTSGTMGRELHDPGLWIFVQGPLMGGTAVEVGRSLHLFLAASLVERIGRFVRLSVGDGEPHPFDYSPLFSPRYLVRLW